MEAKIFNTKEKYFNNIRIHDVLKIPQSQPHQKQLFTHNRNIVEINAQSIGGTLLKKTKKMQMYK